MVEYVQYYYLTKYIDTEQSTVWQTLSEEEKYDDDDQLESPLPPPDSGDENNVL